MKFTQIKYFIDKFHDTSGSGKIIRFTTRAAFFSVFIGSFALILSLSILDGFEEMLTETTAKFTSDISVVNMKGGFVATDSLDFSTMSSIDAISEVIEKPVIIRKKKEIDGFVLRGIDYAKDIKLNISSLANDETLNEQQLWGAFLASALASRNEFMISQINAAASSESTHTSHLERPADNAQSNTGIEHMKDMPFEQFFGDNARCFEYFLLFSEQCIEKCHSSFRFFKYTYLDTHKWVNGCVCTLFFK